MDKLLKKTKDTRYLDDPTQDDIWETYPRLSGAMRTFQHLCSLTNIIQARITRINRDKFILFP